MKARIVLAMHGAPPIDFPRHEIRELFELNARIDHMPEEQRPPLERRQAELDAKVRAWPRTPENDPYHAAAVVLAEQLALVTGHETLAAFNEFCSPSLDEALEQATQPGTERVFVVTPMTTRGGDHSEREIPKAVQRAQARTPEIPITYVWPIQPFDVATFLAEQIHKFS